MAKSASIYIIYLRAFPRPLRICMSLLVFLKATQTRPFICDILLLLKLFPPPFQNHVPATNKARRNVKLLSKTTVHHFYRKRQLMFLFRNGKWKLQKRATPPSSSLFFFHFLEVREIPTSILVQYKFNGFTMMHNAFARRLSFGCSHRNVKHAMHAHLTYLYYFPHVYIALLVETPRVHL